MANILLLIPLFFMTLLELTHVTKQWFSQHTHSDRWSEATLWHRARTVVCHHYGFRSLDWATHLHTTHHQGRAYDWGDLAWLWNQPHRAGAPLSRLLGWTEFAGHIFCLNQDTLDPRWETEGLVHGMHERLCRNPSGPKNWRMLDVGTGSGCILISLLKLWPEAQGWGLDISPHALQAASDNAVRLNVDLQAQWLHSDGLEAVYDWAKTDPFDVILSNPPYIDPVTPLDDDVRLWDPPRALFALNHGLALYETWIPHMWELLAPGGLLGLEIGHDQAQPLARLMAPYPWTWEITMDQAGHPRYVWACKKAPLSDYP